MKNKSYSLIAVLSSLILLFACAEQGKDFTMTTQLNFGEVENIRIANIITEVFDTIALKADQDKIAISVQMHRDPLIQN